MTNAPERITAWVDRAGVPCFEGGRLFPKGVEVEYIRADLAQALVAAALDAAVSELQEFETSVAKWILSGAGSVPPTEAVASCQNIVRALTPDDARAAMDRMLKDAAPKVKPLVWADFDGRGAKASGWRKANYLITKWSDGRFDLVESYPGHSGEYIQAPRYDSLEAAKAAAQADYESRILEALA